MDECRSGHDRAASSGLRGLALCERWISDCLHPESDACSKRHTSCRNHRATSQSATLRRPRIIMQLRKENDQEGQLSYRVRPYPSSGGVLYATVSHPDWTDDNAFAGTGVDAKCTDPTDEICPWAEAARLPVCFREAAQVAIAGGVEYLWIPQMCSIRKQQPQDEAEGDKDEDENFMRTRAHIYAGSAFNIAAMACTRPTDPLLPLSLTPTVPVVRPAWTASRQQEQQQQQAAAIYKRGSFADSVTHNSPLWGTTNFHMEILLAPAILYCARDQLWWQCFHGHGGSGVLCSEALAMVNGGSGGDDGTIGQIKEAPTAYGLEPLLSLPGSPDLRGFKSFPESLGAAWTNAVGSYSTIAIRSPAMRTSIVDAVAECMSLFLADAAPVYAHGCWSDGLVEQLAWYVIVPDADKHPSRSGEEVLPCRDPSIPSWSWLSIVGCSTRFEFPISTVPGVTSSNKHANAPHLSPLGAAQFSIPSSSFTSDSAAKNGGGAAAVLVRNAPLVPARVGLREDNPPYPYDTVLELQGLGKACAYWDSREELDRVHVPFSGHASPVGDRSSRDLYFAWPIFAHFYESRGVIEARGVLLRLWVEDRDTVVHDNNDDKMFVRCGWFRYSEQVGAERGREAIANLLDPGHRGSAMGMDFMIV